MRFNRNALVFWLAIGTVVAAALLVGSVSLSGGLTGDLALYDPQTLFVYLAALATGHIAFVLAGRRTDQILLPVMGLLGGISLLLMQRLPQDLVTQHWFGIEVGLAQVQLVWLVLGIAITSVIGIVVRSDSWLRRYKYTWAAAGVGLLLLTFVFGTEVNGQRLTLQIGPFSGQPSEFLKVILVVFLAGYLSENRSLLMEQDTRVGPLRLPPVPYLAPMVAMWAIALVIVVIQKDLGAALLFFGVFLSMLYVATARVSLVIIGLILFVLGSILMANLFDTVRQRFDIWLDPFADPLVRAVGIDFFIKMIDGELDPALFEDVTPERVQAMIDGMAVRAKFFDDYFIAATDRGIRQAVILASIVEKETGHEADRGLVSAVFNNRLRVGMPLQTDPTVIYGLGDAFDGNLRKVHLQTDTPFNTYTRGGLPPTPIAMPGRASLLAAVRPEPSRALYFVASGGGRSAFSETLAEHNRAVNRYQRQPH